MIDFYYWPTPNGWKIAIALEEMGIPYTTHLMHIGKSDQFKPDFLKISPNNRMLAIVDHNGTDGAPRALFESGAILQYLARETGKFYGATYRDQLAVDQWLMWQMSGLGPMAGQNHHFNKYAPLMGENLTYAQDRYTQETARLYRVLNTQLAQSDYVAGDFFSIADMAIWPWYGNLIAGNLYGDSATFLDTQSYTHVVRWQQEIWQRPAVKRGRKVNRLAGKPSDQLHERHDASDFDLRTEDKLNPEG